MLCGKQQPIGASCIDCNQCLSHYYCSICRLFDDDPDHTIYHCQFCNVCRRGKGLGIDFFHCMKCNSCMHIGLFNRHKCRENCIECDCPVCHEKLFDSCQPIKVRTIDPFCICSVHHMHLTGVLGVGRSFLAVISCIPIAFPCTQVGTIHVLCARKAWAICLHTLKCWILCCNPSQCQLQSKVQDRILCAMIAAEEVRHPITMSIMHVNIAIHITQESYSKLAGFDLKPSICCLSTML